MHRSISNALTIVVVAVVLVIGGSAIYSVNTLAQSSGTSSSLPTSNSGIPATVTSCSPSPCSSSPDSERMTTINGSTFVVINGTDTESVTCVVPVPPPQGYYLQVVTDSGSPLSGLAISVQSAPNASCNQSDVHLTGKSETTNSSGWIFVQGWLYYLVFTYSGRTYNFTLQSDPMAWTLATINVPSGMLTSHICGLGGGSLTSNCQTGSTTTVSS